MAARKKLDLLTAVEQIVEKAKGTGLSSDFYRKADKYIKYVPAKDLKKPAEIPVDFTTLIQKAIKFDIRKQKKGKK